MCYFAILGGKKIVSINAALNALVPIL